MKALFFFILGIVSLNANAAISGWVDATNFAHSVADGFGWVCDAANPSTNFTVNLYSDGVYIGSTSATVQRESAVAALCGGNANHGYVFHYPSSVLNGAAHSISAYVTYNGSSTEIPGSPITVQDNSSESPHGFLDYVTSDYAWGWACDPNETNTSNPAITVTFYKEDGTVLGTAKPTIYRRENTFLQESGCGSQYRGFEFSFGTSLPTNGATHTIYAATSNADGTGRQLIPNSPQSHRFQATAYNTYASQPTVLNLSQSEQIAGNNVYNYLSAPGGTFLGAFYCLGNSTNTFATWDPSGYTGYSAPSDRQMGPTNTIGTSIAQSYSTVFGIYINGTDPLVDPTCEGYVGNTPGFSWGWQQSPGSIPPYGPIPWPSESQTDMSKELAYSIDIQVPYSAPGNGVVYAQGILLFRDQVNNALIYIGPQIYDSRSNQPSESIFAAGDIPIIATAFGLTGSYGRGVSGAFKKGITFSGFRHYEYHLNGYQFENALHAGECSNSVTNKLSCNAYDYQLIMAVQEIESYNGGKIGSSIKNFQIKRSR